MAIPQNVIDARADLVAAKGNLDAAVTKSRAAYLAYRAAGDVVNSNAAFGAWAKLCAARAGLDALHSDISADLIRIHGVADMGPIVLGPGGR